MKLLGGRVASVVPPVEGMDLFEFVGQADSMIGVAMRVVGMIRDEDPEEAWRFVAGLSDERRTALPFVLAAMVDDNRTAAELLSWAPYLTPERFDGLTCHADAAALLRFKNGKERQPCGTQAAFDRHVAHGEEPCDACWVAHRKWDNDRKKRRRARKKLAQAMAAVRELHFVQAELPTVDPTTDKEADVA